MKSALSTSLPSSQQSSALSTTVNVTQPTTPTKSEDALSGTKKDSPPFLAQVFLEKLIRLRLLSPQAVARFNEQHSERFSDYDNVECLGNDLIKSELLTEYQLERIFAGTTHGLVLGNHKVMNRLGAGGMGVIYLAEHLYLNRQEAIKVLPVDDDCPADLLERFYAEMQVLAGLGHPHIVAAFDAGQVPAPSPDLPSLLYLAMELVDGGDLEHHVLNHGLPSISQACEWTRQAALGLQAAHDCNLIHRDIKPSNLLLTTNGQIKIVDFGLVRQFCNRVTKRGTLMGSIEFMPPEQSWDASGVGTAADIYGLGATLFWLLTGQPPYPRMRTVSQALEVLRKEPPRSLRALQPEVPVELESLVQDMLNRDPTRRPALPLTVARALFPFASASSQPASA